VIRSDPRPPRLVTARVRTTVAIARQAFLKGSECQIATNRPLNSGCGREKRPKTLLLRDTAESAQHPLLISR